MFQIMGFGTALLDGVDPNPTNFVGAGVIHTKNTQVGCLLRLEPNTQAQVRTRTHAHTHRYTHGGTHTGPHTLTHLLINIGPGTHARTHTRTGTH